MLELPVTALRFHLEPAVALHQPDRFPHLRRHGIFAPATPDPLLGEFSLDILRGGESEPGYAQFAGLADLSQGKGFRLVRLEIIPEDDLIVWAMASVTNNGTQQVTGVYPNE